MDIDVLIAGAGPVGLFLANECARRGMRYRIVEKRSGQSEHSKALAIFPRTMEIFDMAGLVDPFLEKANRVTSVAVKSHERNLALMPFTPHESPYDFIAMVPQNVTEQLLAEELARRGGAIEYETSFVSGVEQDGGVRVTLERKGQHAEVTARFVVGCDGAHSAVRHLLNLPFEGGEYRDLFLLADIATNDALPADQLQLCPSEFGPVAIFPMSATRRRVVATITETEGDAPSLGLVQKILKQRAPKEIEARSLYWSSYFHIHHRHVSRLRVGRFFIAGDAAHIHSPFGGQGMNTGLHDVWNLAWKLDLFLQGRGTEELLDSYSSERLPVIKQVIETTHHMTRVMGTPNKVVQALRDVVIPMVSRLAPFQHAFVQRLSELGVAYRGSPIIDGPGKRYFDESIRGGEGVLSRFILSLDENADRAAREAADELLQTFPDLLELRLAKHEGLILIRPDGYIAYEGTDRDLVSSAPETIRQLLKKQSREPESERSSCMAMNL